MKIITITIAIIHRSADEYIVLLVMPCMCFWWVKCLQNFWRVNTEITLQEKWHIFKADSVESGT